MATQINIKSTGTTYAAPSSASANQVSGVAPGPSIAGRNDDHRRSFKRWFIGPMPEKVVATEVKKQKMDWRKRFGRQQGSQQAAARVESASDTSSDSSDDDDDDCGPPVDRERLKDYFIHRGGNEEDWEGNRDVQRRIQKEIRRRWKESGWYGAWRSDSQKKQTGENRKWVGKSFVIGDVLGTGDNIVHGASSLSLGPVNASQKSQTQSTARLPSSLHPMSPESTSINDDSLPQASSSSSPGRFTTAHPDTSTTGLLHTSTYLGRPQVSERPVSEIIVSPATLDRTATAFTTGSDGHDPLAPASGLRSALKNVQDKKGKRKLVNFGGDEIPQTASPGEVLARSGPDVLGTSAEMPKPPGQEAEPSVTNIEPLNPKAIIMQDRMLVKVSHNRSEGLPHPYDEAEAGRHPDTLEEDWAEYMVCWRGNHLELYEDWSLPGKKYFVNGKHLAFIIQLRKPDTRIALYSTVDFSFCLTCRPIPTSNVRTAPISSAAASKRTILHRSKSGTNIFVFNLKSRSRAIDWMWHIWQRLGGQLPPTLEVHCPGLNSRIRIDIPEYDTRKGEGYKMLSRHNVLESCQESLSGSHLYEKLIVPELERGRKLELCWRRGVNLEWIWVDEDIDGMPRDWAVVYFAGFREVTKGPTQLELRLGRHAATEVTLTNGTKLAEPPGIEGYLYRIKPNSKVRSLTYVSTHGGNIFTMSIAHSYPPSPPAPPGTVAESIVKDPVAQELRRGAQQILSCEGYVDMRSVMAIRRATDVSFPKSVNVESGAGNISGVNDAYTNDNDVMDDENETSSDHEDPGGDEAWNASADKIRLKLKRTFELVLRNGHIVRLEAHSAVVALEWIKRLKALVSYWTRRHRVDARQEMDLTHAVSGRPRWSSSDVAPDVLSDYPYIGEFWNWCVLDGCRPIVRAGRLFEKRGFHKQFKHKYHVLTHGHLVQFHLTTNKSAHHHRSRSINLVDAYVYSGQLAVASLPKGYEGSGEQHMAPKRYQDGLESEATDEDVTFIIWYRPHSSRIPVAEGPLEPGQDLKKPHLGDKHKVLVCKARSKLERDSWCFALKTEIERVTQLMPERERRLRDDRRIS